MPVEYKDYYQIRGVDRSVDAEAIKRAYRRLARKYHPDVNKGKGAAERFKEINEAYEVLSDPEKRKRYDMLGADWSRYSQQAFRPGARTFRFTLGRHLGISTWAASVISSRPSSATSACTG